MSGERVTTRLPHILRTTHKTIDIDEMRDEEALSLICANLPAAGTPAAWGRLAALAKRLGYWAQMLSIANGWIRERVSEGEKLGEALDKFEQRLKKRGLTGFDPKDEAQRNRAIRACVEASLEDLDPNELDRLYELAVVPEDEDVPLNVVARLWAETGGVDEDDADELIQQFNRLSLLQKLKRDTQTLRLHDNMIWYLRDGIGANGYRAAHQVLVRALRARCEGNWAKFSPNDHPVFAQPQPTADPTQFRLRHPSDAAAYKTIDELNTEHKLGPMPFPAPRGGTEPILTLAQVLGPSGDEAVKRIAASGQLVFHAVGDTGSTRGPHNQSLVADKMIADFDEEASENVPQFFFHLGDVIYNFGEVQYYYDQFYEPYRDYPAPIVALAGNHDGMVAPGTNVSTLAAFLDNFCATDFVVTPEAGGLSRTAQIQPGVFFTFEAPLLRIIALYSNVLEDPGVIASPEVGNAQRAQIDQICAETGVWPHAVLSAHAHNYQRFTRVHQAMQIPYVLAGNGGHNVARLKRVPDAGGPPMAAADASKTSGTSRYETPFRAPTVLQTASEGNDLVRLENYDDQDYGYLRIVVTQKQLRIEYHPAPDGDAAKTPDDLVAVDLASRKLAAPEV